MSKTRFYTFSETISKDNVEPNMLVSYPNNNNNDENNEDNDDDSEFLQDVPGSSSSIDRSSTGSIPWADDAIKQNQLDWEQVERMLSGEEALPSEPDLRNEILEWQQKFPELLIGKKLTDSSQNHLTAGKIDIFKSSESRPLPIVDDLISHLSLSSSDDNDDRYDELTTPTAAQQRFDHFGEQVGKRSPTKKSYVDRLSAKMSLLRIAAIPLRFTQRNDAIKLIPQQTSTEHEHSGTSNSLRTHKISTSRPQPKHSPGQTHYKDRMVEPHQRLRMPPILNVLESKRRFRDLTSNKSFVQLTQVKTPHAKSAAIIRQAASNLPIGIQTRPTAIITSQHQGVWQKPIIASRVSSNFLNNRNAIILPSLNTQRISAQHPRNSTTSSTGADTRTQSLSNSNFGSSPSSSANIDLRHQFHADRFVSRWQQIHSNHTSTSTGTGGSTGRSVSAAVHHPRADVGFRELILPYNAFKRDGFK